MLRRPVFLLIAGLGLAAVASVGVACRRLAAEPAVAEKPLRRVVVAPVIHSTQARPVRVPGVLARKAEAELSFKTGGLVAAVLVRAGDTVAAGQPLACLELAEIDALVVQARAARDKARRDLARVERLAASAVTTVENLQDACTALEMAEAGLRIAEFNRRHAEITAPAAGRILRRSAEPGELVAPGRAIIAFAADGEGWLVRAQLADTDAARVAVGDGATVRSGGAAPASGRVSQMAGAADPVTRTTPIEVQLDTVPAGARSGVVVALTLQPQAVAARAVVPLAALVAGDGRRAHVLILDAAGGTARRVAVEVAALVGAEAHLATDLPAGTDVIVQGAELVRDGEHVAVTRPLLETAQE